MPSLIIYRLIREINEYYNQIQNKSSFKYMNKDNVRDTNYPENIPAKSRLMQS